jgi:hypothetical protein
MVVSLIDAISPDRRTYSAISAELHRDKGTPIVAGNSHAMALTSTINSGGKNPGSARARPLVEPAQALLEEPFTPHAYDLAPSIEPLRNFVVGKTLSSHQNHLGAHN